MTSWPLDPSQEVTQYLPAALVHALRATIKNSENRTAWLLFKLTVGMEGLPDDLEKLRAQCVRNVKAANGSISHKAT